MGRVVGMFLEGSRTGDAALYMYTRVYIPKAQTYACALRATYSS